MCKEQNVLMQFIKLTEYDFFYNQRLRNSEEIILKICIHWSLTIIYKQRDSFNSAVDMISQFERTVYKNNKFFQNPSTGQF